MENVIETRGLTRKFGKKEAIRDLSFEVPSGCVFAFLGPNGAGKTTTIKVLMNIIEPTAGEAFVLGTKSTRLKPAELAKIGYVSENQKLPGWMTVGRLVEYCRPLYPGWDDEYCRKLASEFGLSPKEKLKNLSRGMGIKAALLVALAYRPELLVLDEPFGGLDPIVRDELIHGVLEMTEQGSWTVFISSHDIEEVERLADWVGFLNEGRLILVESIEKLQSRFREVQILKEGGVAAPASHSPAWLNMEVSGRLLRFVDSEYSEAESMAKFRAEFGEARIEMRALSLREIFVVLAKRHRMSDWSRP